MQNPARTSAPLVLALCTAFLLGALALQLLTRPGRPADPADRTTSAQGEDLGTELRAIHDQLVQLTGLLEGQSMSLPAGGGAPAGRSTDVELAAALRALTDALGQATPGTAANLGSSGAPMGSAALQRGGPIASNMAGQLTLVEDLKRDSDTALDRMFGLSVRTVYEQLGRPTYANMSEGGVIWHYGEIGPEEEDLTIYIHDGVVVNVYR